ncbi:MAG: RNA ligase [Myxococcota bacterium]
MDAPQLTTLRDYVGRGLLSAHEQDGLVIFNYTPRTIYERAWDVVTLQARGLVLDGSTGTVHARPWPKFFNHNEPDGHVPDGEPNEVTMKLDGSLGIGYVDATGTPRFATRGRFDSPQAQTAEALWARDHSGRRWPEAVTPLVEIIDPSTKVIVQYEWSGLVLLGVRDHNGDDWLRSDVETLAKDLAMRVVESAPLDRAALTAAAQELDHRTEGFVARWGSPKAAHRVKYKSAAYLALARVLSGITERFVGDCWIARVQLPPDVPEETRQWFDDVVADFETEAQRLAAEIEALHNALRMDHPGRKAFAIAARAYPSRMGLLMARYSDRPLDVRTFVYRERFGNHPRPVPLKA